MTLSPANKSRSHKHGGNKTIGLKHRHRECAEVGEPVIKCYGNLPIHPSGQNIDGSVKRHRFVAMSVKISHVKCEYLWRGACFIVWVPSAQGTTYTVIHKNWNA